VVVLASSADEPEFNVLRAALDAEDAIDAAGEGRPGRDLEPSFSRAVFDRLTALGRSAAERLNELRLCPGPAVEGREHTNRRFRAGPIRSQRAGQQ